MTDNEEKLCKALEEACCLMEGMLLGVRLFRGDPGLLKVEDTEYTRNARALIAEVQAA